MHKQRKQASKNNCVFVLFLFLLPPPNESPSKAMACMSLYLQRYAYIFYDVECDRSDSARLLSAPVLSRSPPSVSFRLFR